MRFHKLQNVQNVLDYLQKVKKIKLVNIRNDEIVDGNPKLILGLLWTLILHFQVGKNPLACAPDTPFLSPVAFTLHTHEMPMNSDIFMTLLILVFMCVSWVTDHIA